VSDTPLGNFGSSDVDVAEYAIQSRGNRLAMPDLSVDASPQRSPYERTSPSSTKTDVISCITKTKDGATWRES
jgi:hypothetical protein